MTAAAALVLAATAGCAGADPAEGPGDADVDFASAMTEHHAQTVELVNLPQARTLPTDAWAWTDGVRTRRLDELERLAGLLHEWEEPVPETGLQHIDEGTELVPDTSIAGVVPRSDIRHLGRLHGPELAEAWLGLLLRHEQGAVRLAEQEVAEGRDAAAVDLARGDLRRHEALVAELQDRFGGSG